MDLAQLKAAAAAAREFTVALAGADGGLPKSMALRLITAHEAEQLALGGASALSNVQLLRATLEHSVIGWQGVLASDVVPGQPDEPLPFSAEALRLLLDERPDWERLALSALLAKADERNARLGLARKN